jgi:VanZ family protein
MRIKQRSAARILTVAVGLLIVWGSLYPFDFLIPTPAQLAVKLGRVASPLGSHADAVTNLLLYMPFGAVCLLAISGPTRALRSVYAALVGSVLSATLELAQLTTPHRVTSLYDWLWNTVGATCGAIAVAMYLSIGERHRFRSLMAGRPALIPLCLIGLWFASQFAPYSLSFGFSLLAPTQLSIVNASFDLASWWVLAECARRIWRFEYAAWALMAMITLTLFGRLCIATQHLSAEEIGAWCIVLAGMIFTARQSGIMAITVAGVACVFAMLFTGLWPFETTHMGRFHWIPFSGSLLITRDYRPLLEKLFLYAAALWSLSLSLGRLNLALALTFTLTTAIEIEQLWMPDRRAEITDPLLILGLGVAFAIARRFQPHAFGSRRDSVASRTPPHANKRP